MESQPSRNPTDWKKEKKTSYLVIKTDGIWSRFLGCTPQFLRRTKKHFLAVVVVFFAILPEILFHFLLIGPSVETLEPCGFYFLKKTCRLCLFTDFTILRVGPLAKNSWKAPCSGWSRPFSSCPTVRRVVSISEPSPRSGSTSSGVRNRYIFIKSRCCYMLIRLAGAPFTGNLFSTSPREATSWVTSLSKHSPTFGKSKKKKEINQLVAQWAHRFNV